MELLDLHHLLDNTFDNNEHAYPAVRTSVSSEEDWEENRGGHNAGRGSSYPNHGSGGSSRNLAGRSEYASSYPNHGNEHFPVAGPGSAYQAPASSQQSGGDSDSQQSRGDSNSYFNHESERYEVAGAKGKVIGGFFGGIGMAIGEEVAEKAMDTGKEVINAAKEIGNNVIDKFRGNNIRGDNIVNGNPEDGQEIITRIDANGQVRAYTYKEMWEAIENDL